MDDDKLSKTPRDIDNPGGEKDRSSSSSLFKTFAKVIGPGVITGASDDDPSGIATYSQAGAQFGFGMLWMALFLFPLMNAIQEMCARIGLLTGSGLAGLIKKKYTKKAVYPIAGLLVIANTINIGADIGAMTASVSLLSPVIPFIMISLSFTALILLLEIIIPYDRYVKILKYLTISLFAYFITAIIVGGNWIQIVVASVVPHIELTPTFAMMFVAMFGTTISPYMFFWQAAEEAEEDVAKYKIKDVGQRTPKIAKKEVKLMRTDVAVGMAFSQVITWAIIITAAESLHNNGITDIQTAQQAAKSLEPLVKTFPHSGEISKTIFALGIIGTGLLAIPVLAGSSGYALSETFGWREGLSKKFSQAKGFYLVIAASTIIGLWINYANIDPIKALVYAAVINAIVAVPILIVIMRIANDRNLLKGKTNGLGSNIGGWLTVFIMGISVAIMVIYWRLQ